MSRRGLIAVAATVLLLTGCASQTAPGSPTPEQTAIPEFTAVPLVELTHPDVLAYCPEQAAGHLDVAPAEVVEVYRCSTEFSLEGGATVEHVDRVVDAADLLAVYSLPDEERPAEVACTMEMADPLIVWLELTTGDTVAVRAPTDECGKPQADARAEVDGAEYESVLDQPLTEG